MFNKKELFKIYDGLTEASRHLRELMKNDEISNETRSRMDYIASGYESVAKKARTLFDEKMKEEAKGE